MAIQINGNGTITGISAGGLPAGTVTSATLASGAGGKVVNYAQTFKTDVTFFDGAAGVVSGDLIYLDYKTLYAIPQDIHNA